MLIGELNQPREMGRTSCAHCGEGLPNGAASAFCCAGCEVVALLLDEHGLNEYYALRKRFMGERRPRKSPPRAGLLAESMLEDPDQVRRAARDPAGDTLVFALEGIQCAACLWLLERLPQACLAVRQVRVDLGRGEIWVTRHEGASFPEIARFLRKLGYPPHVVRPDATQDLGYTAENRSSLMRLGVAASAAGNVMLYAISVYAGASGRVAMYFAWLSFALSIPVVTYSAWPLWKSMFASLRMGRITLDVPVMLAIAISFGWSTARLLAGNPHVFFDSISALIFLLLASRYILRKMQQRSALLGDVSPYLLPVWCIRLRSGSEERVLSSSLKPDDRVRVETGGRFPADGVLEQDAQIATAFLTGESLPRLVRAQESVYAGSENCGNPVIFRVCFVGLETRLQKILARAQAQVVPASLAVTYQAKVDTAWTLAALTLSFLVGWSVGWNAGWPEGASRALALLIVTCPCGFAFAAPLAQAFALALARGKGIYVKDGATVSRGAEIRTVLLDKTGTVTVGELECIAYSVNPADLSRIRKIVHQMEHASAHPVARALVRWAGESHAISAVSNVEPLPSGGVRMREQGVTWEIVPLSAISESGVIQVELRKNGESVATWNFRDQSRADAPELIRSLHSSGYSIALISGDRKAMVTTVGRRIGLSAESVMGEMSPEQKEAYVRGVEKAMFVGDGANDALALRAAHVGFAVQGSVEASLEAASVYSAVPGLGPVRDFLEICTRYRRVTRRALALSFIYNAFGAMAAILGWVSPLFAAVLMPVSAVSVFAMVWLGLRK